MAICREPGPLDSGTRTTPQRAESLTPPRLHSVNAGGQDRGGADWLDTLVIPATIAATIHGRRRTGGAYVKDAVTRP
jgi:hypothetical protein